jgi:hypothetical protein
VPEHTQKGLLFIASSGWAGFRARAGYGAAGLTAEDLLADARDQLAPEVDGILVGVETPYQERG